MQIYTSRCASRRLRCKGEPYWFNGKQHPLVQTDKHTNTRHPVTLVHKLYILDFDLKRRKPSNSRTSNHSGDDISP